MKKSNLFEFDKLIRQEYPRILGIDEVGRGCGAGVLVVAGVVLDPSFFDERIKDSKLIKSITTRKELKDLILKNSLFYQIEIIEPIIVDKFGPKQTSIQGMTKIANKLIDHFDICLTDFEKIINLKKHQMNLVKGDATSFSIACASIVAKSTRDDCMKQLSIKYPNYEFNSNQGYLTKKHLQLIERFGPIKNVHRFSYKPISKFIINK